MLKRGLKLIITLAMAAGMLYSQDNISEKLQSEYTKIAYSFVQQSAKKLFRNWKDTNVTKLTPFYSSNDHLIAFEASLAKSYDANRTQGYLFVTVQKDKPLINTFSVSGNSISNTLMKFWNDQYAQLCKDKELKIENFKFLIVLPSSYAIGVKITGDADFLDNVPQQNGYYIFTPFPQSQYADYTDKIKLQTRGSAKKPPISSADENEREAFKKALIDKDFDNVLFQVEDKGEIKYKKQTRDTISVHGTFAPFYQEYRYWNNNSIKSYAGCVPVAWSILYEYWDERGYANLVGSTNANRHYDVTDWDIRDMISRLRTLMDIEISETTRESGTDLSGVLKGVQYAHERGYYNFSAYIVNNSQGWNDVKKAIKQSLPPLVTIYTTDIKHEAVAYKYIDMYGVSNDYICMRTGWSEQPDQCWNRIYTPAFTIVTPKGNENSTQHTNDIKYGAVAVSVDNPQIITIGAKWNTFSLEDAKQTALQSCRSQISTGCKLLKTVENGCFAIAQVPYQAKGSYATASNIENAQYKARHYCNYYSNTNDCFIRLAFCSNKKGYVAHTNPSRDNKPIPPKPQVTPKNDGSDEYAAIAMSVRDGRLIRWGRSWHKSSLFEAKKTALRACSHSDCKVIAYAKNQCVSVAKVKYQNIGSYVRADSYNAAKNGALRNCNNRGFGKCISVATACAQGQ